MKLYIDDERPCPEGWDVARSFHEALRTVDAHREEITHIAFDWMLHPDRPSLNGEMLLRELIYAHYAGDVLFTHPRAHYICHSSDDHHRSEMEKMLDDLFAAPHDEERFQQLQARRRAVKQAGEREFAQPKSRLDRLRKAKRR